MTPEAINHLTLSEIECLRDGYHKKIRAEAGKQISPDPEENQRYLDWARSLSLTDRLQMSKEGYL